MKRLIFIICWLLCYMPGHSQSGPTPGGPPRKSMSLSPIEIVESESGISLSFNINSGTISINIFDAAGNCVYTNQVEVMPGKSLTINTKRWVSKEYIIRVKDEDGSILKEMIYYKE